MIHAMIDVEALRLNKPWIAPLMEIGVVLFNERASIIGHRRILVKQDMLPDWASIEPDTLKFWEDQSYFPELKRDIARLGVSAQSAMEQLCAILETGDVQVVWFAGPQYDQVMLEAYLSHYGIKYPWRYNDVRDFRTIRKQFPNIWSRVNDQRTGSHEAVEDCKHQVAVLREIWKAGCTLECGWQ